MGSRGGRGRRGGRGCWSRDRDRGFRRRGIQKTWDSEDVGEALLELRGIQKTWGRRPGVMGQGGVRVVVGRYGGEAQGTCGRRSLDVARRGSGGRWTFHVGTAEEEDSTLRDCCRISSFLKKNIFGTTSV